jgi:hypothetical protein
MTLRDGYVAPPIIFSDQRTIWDEYGMIFAGPKHLIWPDMNSHDVGAIGLHQQDGLPGTATLGDSGLSQRFAGIHSSFFGVRRKKSVGVQRPRFWRSE